MSWQTDIAICRRMLRGGSKTFFAASKVLPRAVGDPAIALYAFCREADDAIDGPGRRVDAIEVLHDRLDRIYDGAPDDSPVDRALAGVVAQFEIPRALPEALLEGLAWDAQGRRYETLSDVLAYAVRVAGTVGVMMSLLMNRREAETIGRACDLGIAMQLTNIARDVGEDARAGRLYLPRQWLREAGLDVETWRAAPFFDDRIGRVTARLLAVADVFYARASAGIADLPWNCRPGIHAARLIYAEIGREVARAEFDLAVAARLRLDATQAAASRQGGGRIACPGAALAGAVAAGGAHFDRCGRRGGRAAPARDRAAAPDCSRSRAVGARPVRAPGAARPAVALGADVVARRVRRHHV
ncbi:phytoene/squalene synthase family protein [Streptomyces sp. L7]